MDELENLRQENERLKNENAQLRETIEVVQSMNRFNEIGKYIEQRQRALSIIKLVNATSSKEALEEHQLQKEVEQALAEKSSLDAKIFEAMREIENTPSIETKNDFLYTETFGGIEIQSFNGSTAEGTLIIPKYIDGKFVVQIGRGAFKNAKFRKVHLPQSIRRIKSCAFQKCTNLEFISFPREIQAIDDMAFLGCRNLKSIQLPETLEFLGAQSFSNTGLEQIEIPKKIARIERSTFSGCHNLKVVLLKEGLKYIGEFAFYDTAVQNITLPLTVLQVGKSAFGSQYAFKDRTKIFVLNRNTVFDTLPPNADIHKSQQVEKKLSQYLNRKELYSQLANAFYRTSSKFAYALNAVYEQQTQM